MAGPLNLVVSTVVFVAGLIIFRFRRPEVFTQHPYIRVAFGFWIFQWVGFMLIFAIFEGASGLGLGWLLAMVDLQSVFALGFSVVFLAGDEFHWKQSLFDLGIIYILLIVWNLAFIGAASRSNPADLWRATWIFPSEVLSALSLGLMAVAFLMRYRWPAFPFALIAFVYVILQRPVYEAKFVEQHPEPGWIATLAFGKLLLGGLFYTMFFLEAKNYGSLWVQPWQFNIPIRGAKLLNRSILLLGGIALHVTSILIAHRIERFFPRLSN